MKYLPRRYVQGVIVGILSDTHGRADAAGVAVALLVQRGAEFLIHCGDVGGDNVLDHLAGHRALFVFGNNDWDHAALARYARVINVTCGNAFAEVQLGGKAFAVTHGDDMTAVRRVLHEQKHDYLLVGHSHVPADHREGRVRVLNPGALYRAREKTVALLDTATDRFEVIVVPGLN